MSCQIVRSATLWSNGTQAEHSVQDAYIDIISKSQHFVYIENQFFITKSNDYTSFGNPVKNQIGRAIVDRVLRAARAGEQYVSKVGWTSLIETLSHPSEALPSS